MNQVFTDPISNRAANTDNFDDDDPPELQAALNQMPTLYRSGLPGEGSSRNTIGQEWSSYGPGKMNRKYTMLTTC